MNTAYFYLTEEGEKLAYKLATTHPGDIYNKENFKENLRAGFGKYDSLVCIMATGIVVRILAPLIVHKTSDPAVVVLDQKGKYAISLLSGHLGGANDLAREMAALSGGEAVITTATDVAGELSFDTFAKKYNMAIENIGQLKHISGALLAGKKVNVFTDKNVEELYPELVEEQKRGMINIFPLSDFFKIYKTKNINNTKMDDLKIKDIMTTTIEPCPTNIDNIESDIPSVVIDERFSLNFISDSKSLPDNITESTNSVSANFASANALSTNFKTTDSISPDTASTISTTTVSPSTPILYLRPRTICAGIGCKRNMEQKPIEKALLQTLKEEGIHPLSLKCIATIPLKSDEPGIIGTAANLNVPLKIIPTKDIEKLDINQLGIATSEFVASQTGVLSVSTACSYLASGKGTILRDKAKYKGITVALSKENF